MIINKVKIETAKRYQRNNKVQSYEMKKDYEILEFREDNSGFYGLRFVNYIPEGVLQISGEGFSSSYRVGGKWTLEEWSKTDMHYFLSKCRSSNFGCNFLKFDMNNLKEQFIEMILNYEEINSKNLDVNYRAFMNLLKKFNFSFDINEYYYEKWIFDGGGCIIYNLENKEQGDFRNFLLWLNKQTNETIEEEFDNYSQSHYISYPLDHPIEAYLHHQGLIKAMEQINEDVVIKKDTKNELLNEIVSNTIHYLDEQIRNLKGLIESCDREYEEAMKMDIGYDNPYADIPSQRKKKLEIRIKEIELKIKNYENEKVEIHER